MGMIDPLTGTVDRPGVIRLPRTIKVQLERPGQLAAPPETVEGAE
jgi:hypothetical protein